jgi:branched-chain amino acid transport system ATP-binding protein
MPCQPLIERRRQLAGTVSGGELQTLVIGRSLMGQPELIMFDEPSLGLAPLVLQEVLHTIHVLHGRALTIPLVEQNVSVALKISQRAHVLEPGRIALSGSGEQLLHDDRVRHAFLGF